MHNTEARWGRVRCKKARRRKMTTSGEKREREREKKGGTQDAIRLGGFETKKRAVTTRKDGEAEINRRKSLFPSALSGPFRPVKIIYRKDWCASPFPVGWISRWSPLVDAKILKRKKKGEDREGKCIRRELSLSLSRFALTISHLHSAKLLEER